METADAIVIGGGVLGCAVAFYLSKRAIGRIILIERTAVASGNSSLAAGLLTRGRFKHYLIPLVQETYRAIEEIESLTGDTLGMTRTGCLYAASSPLHRESLRDLAQISSQAGLRVEHLDAQDAMQLLPWLKLPQDATILLMPEDGYLDGHTLTRGYLQAARRAGVEIRERTEVAAITRQGQRVTGVRTSQGDVAAPLVIDAAGVWAGLLARQIGLALPMAPVRSHYWITARFHAFSPAQPFILLPDARAYARPESDRLLFGFREKECVAVDPRHLPAESGGYLFKQDPSGWESLLEGLDEFLKYAPLIDTIQISSYVKGLSNYTPDGNLVVGGMPGLDGFLAATGCTGAGMAMSGGIGRLVAELALDEHTFVDAFPHRIDRFGAFDPFDPGFMKQCADARSGKITG